MARPSSLLLLLLATLLLVSMMTRPSSSSSSSDCTCKKAKPKSKHLSFYMLIVVQNLTMLHNPDGQYTAVRSAAPAFQQPFTFGVFNTFDNRISRTPSFNNSADLVGRVQGWYGDCGQDQLTLCFTQTFTYDDGRFKGTFGLVGVSVATADVKEAAIVGGTGDFAFCRGVASQRHLSIVSINNEENSLFAYSITFKC